MHRRGRRTARSEQLTLRPGTGRIGGRTANATTWAAPLRCSAWRGKVAGVQVGVLGSSLRQRSGTCTMILLSDAQGICFCFCFCFCICAKHLNAYQLVLGVQDVVVRPPPKPTTVEYCGVPLRPWRFAIAAVLPRCRRLNCAAPVGLNGSSVGMTDSSAIGTALGRATKAAAATVQQLIHSYRSSLLHCGSECTATTQFLSVPQQLFIALRCRCYFVT